MFSWFGRRYISRWLFVTAALAVVTACTVPPPTPLTGPVSAMVDPWGPFARQCADTHVSYWANTNGAHVSPREKSENHGECWGFSVSPGSGGSAVVTASIGGSAAVTASIGGSDRAAAATIIRFQRSPNGEVRTAQAGDMGLSAQGSDDPNAAAQLARQIGLSRQQMIAAHQKLDLLVRLNFPDPVDVPVTCDPDGGGQMHGRATVILSCSGGREIQMAEFVGRLRMAGVEEIDVRSGVVLSSRYSGRMNGEREVSGLVGGRHGDMQLLYSLETEFE
jgi:hypothetical protein